TAREAPARAAPTRTTTSWRSSTPPLPSALLVGTGAAEPAPEQRDYDQAPRARHEGERGPVERPQQRDPDPHPAGRDGGHDEGPAEQPARAGSGGTRLPTTAHLS